MTNLCNIKDEKVNWLQILAAQQTLSTALSKIDGFSD